jgi:hypothetical protein
MIPRHYSWLRRAAVALMIAAAAACGSSTEPSGDLSHVSLGSIVSGELAATDTVQTYIFHSGASSLVLIPFEVQGGDLFVSLVDSVSQQSVNSQFIASGSTLGDDSRLGVAPPSDAVYILRVSAYPLLGHRTFRFQLQPVLFAPEKRPAAFAVGDTVAGETLEAPTDIDVFNGTGQPGQDVTFIAEAPGSAALGPVLIYVRDPQGVSVQGFAQVKAGDPAAVTTGRFTVPASGQFTVRIEAQSFGGIPRYQGAYRFWSYVINHAPESRPAAVTTGVEVTGESIDRASDVDEFTFTAAAGAEINAFIQAPRFRILQVLSPAGVSVGSASSSAADTSLFAHETGRMVLTQGGTYTIRVFGAQPDSLVDVGPYRFFLYPINRAPEHVGAALTLGDTLNGETIDRPGDIDEFTFTGTAGEEFNAFLQAAGSPSSALFNLEVIDADGTRLAGTASTGADSALLGQATGRFAARTTGTLRVRVQSAAFTHSRDTGPYRLVVYRTNPAPEVHAAALVPGDSVFGEAIDYQGDLDNFTMTVPDSLGVNMVVELVGGAAGSGFSAQIRDASGTPIAASGSSVLNQKSASGRIPLGAGTYTIRVDGTLPTTSRQPVAYRIWMYAFRLGAELVNDTVAVGDTVSGESISPIGDGDTYVIHLTKGQHINLMVQGLETSSTHTVTVGLSKPAHGFVGSVASSFASASLSGAQFVRWDVDLTGWYTIGVTGDNPLTATGAYRFAVVPVPTVTETHAAALVLGDSVMNESIDAPADYDDYIVTATPGQEMAVTFDAPVGCCRFPYILPRDAVTGDSLAWGVAASVPHLVGPFITPSSGLVRLQVFEPGQRGGVLECFDATCGGQYQYTGNYHIRTIAVNRAPEIAAAAYTLGDTIRTETITLGDIDEFTVNATPGATLTFSFGLLAPPVPSYGGLAPRVVDAVTGAELIDSGLTVTGVGTGFPAGGTFVVPASGKLIIRIRSGVSLGDGITTGPYQFLLR